MLVYVGMPKGLDLRIRNREMRPLMTLANRVVNRWIEAASQYWIPRNSYLPPQARGTDPMVPDGTDLAIWPYEAEGPKGLVYYAIGFAAKQNKPLFHNAFRDESQRDQRIQQYAADRRALLERKQKVRQEREEFKHELKVGDILYCSWGYDQTQVDFYEIVDLIGPTMVAMREVSQKVVRSWRDAAEYVAAEPGKFVGSVLRKKVSPGNRVKINSYSSAYKWDGEPKYQTGAAAGH